MSKPLVSIITPCYNGEIFLDRYFESILSQSYSPLELIFINDGSTDRTEEIALSYREELENKGILFVYLKQENAGQAAALNRGLKLFTGKYLTWPDSDDVMTPDCIEKKVAFLEKNQEYEMVRSNGTYYNMVTKEKKRISSKESDAKEDIFEDLLLVNTYGCCGCYMITKKVLEQCYPDRDIFESRCGQNWQLLVPVSSRTKCGYIDEELYVVYEHGNSHSRQKRSSLEQIERRDDFTEILLRAVEHSMCDQKKARNLIYKNESANKFYYAIALKDKKILKKIFGEFKQYGNPTMKERLLYFKYMYLK